MKNNFTNNEVEEAAGRCPIYQGKGRGLSACMSVHVCVLAWGLYVCIRAELSKAEKKKTDTVMEWNYLLQG